MIKIPKNKNIGDKLLFLNSLERNFGRKKIAEQNFQTELINKKKKNMVGDRECEIKRGAHRRWNGKTNQKR